MSRSLRLLIVALVLLGPVAIAVFRTGDAKSVEMQAVGFREIRPAVLASGTLVYRHQVQLTPEVIGKVSEIAVKEGEFTERNQVVLRLNPDAFRAEVQQQEALRRQNQINIERQRLVVANMEREHDRIQQLAARKMIAESKVDESTHQLQVARIDLRAHEETLRTADAQVALARERLAKTEILSPLTGIVVSIPIQVGETAVPSSTSIAGSSLMTIAKKGDMVAEINVDEADVAQVSAGNHSLVFAAAFPDRPINATIESISLSPKVATQGQGGRSYVVKARLLDVLDGALRAGMSCRAEILSGNRSKVLALPLQAVLADATGKNRAQKFVYVHKEERARRRNVETGLADDNYIEIRAGLEEGEIVIVEPERELKSLKEGDRVVAQGKNSADARPGKK